MSETDDTDELILIPPDFFVTRDLEEPYLSGPYYHVVDSLISQVNYLENRINSIENKSENSVRSNSINYPVDIHPKTSELMSGIRKYNSSDDINKVTRNGYFESTQSTPQKPQTRFKLSSCSSTSTDRCSPRKKCTFSPPRTNDNIRKFRENNKIYTQKNGGTKEILQEIDQYIFSMQNPKENQKVEATSKNSLNLKDLKYMLQKVDKHSREFDQQEHINKNVSQQNENHTTNINTQIRRKQLPDNSKLNHINFGQVPSTSDVSTYNESSNEKSDSVTSSSESTQMTALPNMNRLEAGGDYNYEMNTRHIQNQNYINENPSMSHSTRRNILEDIPSHSHDNRVQDYRLLSLSHLWNRGGGGMDEYMTKEERILQKLEEEKLRRQHCEQLIQHLQSKTLELQERLAVAVQVDEAKDDAILRFHSSWEQVADRLQSLTKDRNDLEKEIEQMHAQNAENMIEAAKKIAYFENETSKALTLAQNSQEKVKELESQISGMSSEFNCSNVKISQLENTYKQEIEKNKELLEQIEEKNIQLHEINSVLTAVKSEVFHSKKAMEMCQVELATLRSQNTHLEMILSEKDEVMKSLERHNQKLLSEIDTHKKIEKDLQHELNKLKEMNEKNKLELRNFYQDQVEIVVRDKLKEFQSQLNRAETALQEELKKRELTIAKSAAGHIQQIVDKHSLEIQLLEEKHSEEVRLYQMKLSQAHQHLENLQCKLSLQHKRKSDMTKQLHRVMEAQWLEALKIINNGRSPVVTNEQDMTLNQLNVLKTKSHSNLEEVLSMDTTEENREKEQCIKDGAAIPPLNLGASTSSVQEDNFDSCIYSLNMETPLTSRPKTKQQIELELQKYVQLLLNKQPGNPIEELNFRQKDGGIQEIPTWQPMNSDEKLQSKPRDRRLKKPWR